MLSAFFGNNATWRDIGWSILTYLTPSELLSAGFVSKALHIQSQDNGLWQLLLGRHFPYLRQNNTENYQKQPKALFIQEFKRISQNLSQDGELIPNIFLGLMFITENAKPYLLASLRGEVEKIAALPLEEEEKIPLYVRALANGHQIALPKLLDGKSKGPALILAAQQGQLPIVEILSVDSEIPAIKKGKALQEASRYGYLNIVNVLLNRTGEEIEDLYKELSLREASDNGHIDIVELLLKHVKNTKTKGDSLESAAAKGFLNIVQLLLRQDSEIPLENKGHSLFWAAEEGHLSVVAFFLEQYNLIISAKDKMTAWIKSIDANHQDVTHTLTTQGKVELAILQEGLLLLNPVSANYEHFIMFTKDFSQCSGWQKCYILRNAAIKGHLDVMKAIVPHAKIFAGLALADAAQYGQLGAVHILLKEAFEAISDEIINYARTQATENGHVKVLEALSSVPPQPALDAMPAKMVVSFSAKRKTSEEESEPLSDPTQENGEAKEGSDESPQNKRAKF